MTTGAATAPGGAGLVLSPLGSKKENPWEGFCLHLENLTPTCGFTVEKENFCATPGLLAGMASG